MDPNVVRTRTAAVNGIGLEVTEAGGRGRWSCWLHGFPEGWYSWRHQLVVLAAAGFRAVAPDQRGYGRTDRPEPIRRVRHSLTHRRCGRAG